jgi:hypothetical protein
LIKIHVVWISLVTTAGPRKRVPTSIMSPSDKRAVPSEHLRPGTGKMSFPTISLLLNWMEMGALLAILFRLSSTFDLIANTQRELRCAIHRLGERRAAEPGANSAFGGPGNASVSPSRCRRTGTESKIGADDLPHLPF